MRSRRVAEAAALGALVGAVEALVAVHGSRLGLGPGDAIVSTFAIEGVDAAIGAVLGFVAAGAKIPWTPRPLALAVPALLLALASPLVLSHPTPRSVSGSAPDVVLITIDTLRRDHVGAFGDRARTPRLDGLAAAGTAFADAVTEVPETLPSHSSMLTGRSPVDLGVLSNGAVVPADVPTVAERFASAGWSTGAFVSSYVLDSRAGLGRGFDVYDDGFLPGVPLVSRAWAVSMGLRLFFRFGDAADLPLLLERPAPGTIDRALAWARTAPGPLFLWVHLFEPHSPYEPHDGAQSPVDHAAILAREPGYAYTADEERELRRLYAGEVEYVDGQVGVLLDGLRALHRLDHATVLVTGDHGESLGEHGIMFTHHGVYEDVVRVPMILWASGGTARRVGEQVTVSQVAGTLLRAAGLDPPPGAAPALDVGRDVVGLMGRLGMSLNEGRVLGARASGRKVVDAAGYALTDDPREERPTAPDADLTDAVDALRARLDGATIPAKVDDETRARLRALGYAE